MLNFKDHIFNSVLTDVKVIQQCCIVLELFQLTFLAVPLEKKHLASAHSPEDLENASFQPREPGELLLLEVPGLTRFTPHHVLAGLKRTIYFSSETGE